MAVGAGGAQQNLNWRRPVEWLAMALLLLVLIGTFVHYSRFVQSQAEVAAIKSTVGALRTALVVEHLRRQVAVGSEPQSSGANPFKLLGKAPTNYIGELSRAQTDATLQGVWVYAPDCPCVGYRPRDDQALDSPVADPFIWFEVVGGDGLLQLKAREVYRLNDELID